jgi:hypothetical protein
MDWAKFLADERTKFWAFEIFVLFTIVGTICVPVSVILPALLLIDVLILPWIYLAVRMIIDCCCSRYGGCFVSDRWEKIDRAVEYYFAKICVELTLVSLLVMNVAYVIRNRSVFWPSDIKVWQRSILVTFYVFEACLYVFYIAHRIALKKMQDRI